MWHPLYVESKKKWYKWTQLQNKKTLTDLENDLWFPGLGIVRDFGKVMNTLINFKWITTKTYCVAHGTQFSDIRQPGWDGSPGENGYMYMYGWVSSLFTWNYHNIVNWFIPKQKKIFKVKKKNVLHSEWYIAAAVKSPQSCPTLCNPIDSSPPGSPVPGILQATILEWVAIPFSRGSSWPRGWTWVSCTADRLSLSHQGTPWWCIVTSNKRPHVPHSQS